MNFASLEYISFLAIVWFCYWLLPLRGQNILLLVASYYFYAAWDWRFLSLIVFSTVVDYCAGWWIDRSNSSYQRRAALIVSMVTNLGLLSLFKYFGFFVDGAVDLLQALGIEASRPALQIVLPVGISFYTFQTMSYTIDVYRRQLRATSNFLDFALFVTFFPQLVAGPIERATHLLPMIQKQRVFTIGETVRGLFLILLGLVKKMAIADGVSTAVGAVYGSQSPVSGLDVLLATYGFAFQILCDFSAYTDIARGSSKLLGIDLMINFNAPYFARSPSEFWQRWHISLSTWLRDYLYIPLGGNRFGGLSTYRNLMITMVLGGLWHGAAWNFVLWGIYQGTILCLFRLFLPRAKPQTTSEAMTPVARVGVAVWEMVQTLLYFQITCYGWLLFRADSFAQIKQMTTALLTSENWFLLSMPRVPLSVMAGLAFIIPWEGLTYRYHSGSFYRQWHPLFRGALVGVLLILLAMSLSNNASTFIYFQF